MGPKASKGRVSVMNSPFLFPSFPGCLCRAEDGPRHCQDWCKELIGSCARARGDGMELGAKLEDRVATESRERPQQCLPWPGVSEGFLEEVASKPKEEQEAEGKGPRLGDLTESEENFGGGESGREL